MNNIDHTTLPPSQKKRTEMDGGERERKEKSKNGDAYISRCEKIRHSRNLTKPRQSALCPCSFIS